jgi:hypothetical protein
MPAIRPLLSFIFAALCFIQEPATASPTDVLVERYPSLAKLYSQGKAYAPGLEKYAAMQGFNAPFEKIGTVLHELVHIYSATHAGFLIGETYYEPYVKKSSWPSLTNSQITKYVLPSEQGVIYRNYALNTPNNHLGNVIDELNAYSQVAHFICVNEPTSAPKQLRNIVGHLQLIEAYLRMLRAESLKEYEAMMASPETAGAIQTIVQNSWGAAAFCGGDPAMFQGREVMNFLTLRMQRTGK